MHRYFFFSNYFLFGAWYARFSIIFSWLSPSFSFPLSAIMHIVQQSCLHHRFNPSGIAKKSQQEAFEATTDCNRASAFFFLVHIIIPLGGVKWYTDSPYFDPLIVRFAIRSFSPRRHLLVVASPPPAGLFICAVEHFAAWSNPWRNLISRQSHPPPTETCLSFVTISSARAT